jgi:cytochrome c oxidase cbb3-type subunit 3
VSTSWSIYVIALTALNILGCLWLLWWTAKRRPGDRSEQGTTGHVWDGDITELEKPMPRWWLNLFYGTVAFSIGYLVLFPGLGSFAGTKGWTSDLELAQQRAAAEAKLKPLFAQYAGRPVEALAHDDGALKLGRSVFANHCAMCHGSDAKGAIGFPNLTDSDWLWGGGSERVLQTILEGRQGAMPALGAVLGEQGVTEAAVYVQSLSGQPVDARLARQGELKFLQICAACHGADGKGNPALGAPTLTDSVWLYGGSFKQISATVRDGRGGMMPAHKDILGEDRARLVAAFVMSQGPANKAAGAP